MLQNKKTVVKSFIFIASQFRTLIELFGGKSHFPKEGNPIVPLKVMQADDNKVVFIIGNSVTLANLPLPGDDLRLGDRVKLDIYTDRTAEVHTLKQRAGLNDPLLREVSKTVLPMQIFETTSKPVKVFVGERAIFFSNGEEQRNDATHLEREISGGEFIIVYEKFWNEQLKREKIVLKAIIDRGEALTDGAVSCFANCMKTFYRKPCTAFDHLAKSKTSSAPVAPVEVVAEVEAPAKKPAAKAKSAKKTPVKAAEPAAVIQTTEAPAKKQKTVTKKAVTKKTVTKTATAKTAEPTPVETPVAAPIEPPTPPAVKAAWTAPEKVEKPKGNPAARSARNKVHPLHSDSRISSPFANLREVANQAGITTT